MMAKTGAERLLIGCKMTDSARELVWSGIPNDLPEIERKNLFLQRFYGQALPVHLMVPVEEAKRSVSMPNCWSMET